MQIVKKNFALFIATILAAGAFLSAPAADGADKILNTQAFLAVTAESGRVSIDAKNAEIAELLTEVAQKTRTNISLGAVVSCQITLKLSAATVEEALRAISQNSAIVYEYLPETQSWRILQALVVPGAEGKNTAAPGENRQADAGGAGKAAPHKTGAGKEGSNPGPPATTAGAPAAPPSGDRPEERPSYKAGELLVKFKTGAAPEQIAALHARLGSVVIKNLPKLRLQRIKLPPGLAEAEAIRQYQETPIVEHAGRHALRYPQATPNDPGYANPYPGQWNLKKIGSEALWNITTGSRDVIVAVIDSGVDYSHPDLRDNIWINEAEKTGIDGVDDDGNGYIDDIYGWDCANNDNHPFDPYDSYGHGTHVAGIVGAVGDNGVGVSGVNWKIRIMPLKVKADNSSDFTNIDIIEAIDYAIANGAQIVNCSFGGTASDPDEQAAFDRLREKGIIAACAAGNGGYNMDSSAIYPASYNLDNIISVANADSKDALAISSNYGKSTVDVAAPGESIYSTVPLSDTTASVKTVATSPALEYPALGMEYAALTGAGGITGALYDCGMGYSGYACGTEWIDEIPAAVSGNIALIKRGNCDGQDFYFSEKVANAMAKGATGVIIYNNLEDDPLDDDTFDTQGGTLGATGSPIPVVSISKAAGEELLSLLSETHLRVELINKLTVSPYGYKSGTSMATPHVAGLAALISDRCPSSGYADVKAAIINSSDKIPALADKTASGGRINAFTALTSLFPLGDLSADCRISMDDAILAMRILTGLEATLVCPLSTAACRLDTNGDGLIGSAEVIYILQKISGAR